MPAAIRRSGADVLISVGNFALRKSPVPQILLSRNSLYTSADFLRDLRQRREYGLWLDTRIKGSLARRSIHWADRTVAPTEAFAQELRQWTGRDVVAIHHGFDHEAFFRDQTPLPADIRQKLDRETEKDTLRLLYVSHYNYYRNFETLFRALPLMRERLGGRKLKLFLTCRLRSRRQSRKLPRRGCFRPGHAAWDRGQRGGVGNRSVFLAAPGISRLQHLRDARLCRIICAPAGRSHGQRVADRSRPISRCIARSAEMPQFTSRAFLPKSWPRESARLRPRTRWQSSFRIVDRSGRAPFPGTNTWMSCWIWRQIFLLQLILLDNEKRDAAISRAEVECASSALQGSLFPSDCPGNVAELLAEKAASCRAVTQRTSPRPSSGMRPQISPRLRQHRRQPDAEDRHLARRALRPALRERFR